MAFVWSRNTVRESSHISFFCGGDPFREVVRRPENTHGRADRFAWVTSRPPPSLEWSSGLCFQSKIQTLYCLSSPRNTPLRLCIFLFMAGYRNLHTSVFFRSFVDLICERKYLPLYPQALNYILAIIVYFSLSCETTLLLSGDRIESAKFIHGTLSLAKLVYYNM